MHAVTDATGRQVRMCLTASQRSDDKGEHTLLDSLPIAKQMFADRGYDAD